MTGTQNHRTRLERAWLGSGRTLLWCCLNPSTAGEFSGDDASVRKMIGFTKRWGYSRMLLGNLYSYRATMPSDLINLLRLNLETEAIGAGNDEALVAMAADADSIVLAWGNIDVRCLSRAQYVMKNLLADHTLLCIRLTRESYPAHPVREPYTESPIEYLRRIAA
jgi:hypothetical protein